MPRITKKKVTARARHTRVWMFPNGNPFPENCPELQECLTPGTISVNSNNTINRASVPSDGYRGQFKKKSTVVDSADPETSFTMEGYSYRDEVSRFDEWSRSGGQRTVVWSVGCSSPFDYHSFEKLQVFRDSIIAGHDMSSAGGFSEEDQGDAVVESASLEAVDWFEYVTPTNVSIHQQIVDGFSRHASLAIVGEHGTGGSHRYGQYTYNHIVWLVYTRLNEASQNMIPTLRWSSDGGATVLGSISLNNLIVPIPGTPTQAALDQLYGHVWTDGVSVSVSAKSADKPVYTFMLSDLFDSTEDPFLGDYEGTMTNAGEDEYRFKDSVDTGGARIVVGASDPDGTSTPCIAVLNKGAEATVYIDELTSSSTGNRYNCISALSEHEFLVGDLLGNLYRYNILDPRPDLIPTPASIAGGQFTQVTATSSTEWFIANNDGFYYTRNAGRDWTEIDLPVDRIGLGVSRIDTTAWPIGYIATQGNAGDSGFLFYTVDGGCTWQRVTVLNAGLSPGNSNGTTGIDIAVSRDGSVVYTLTDTAITRVSA